MSIFKMDSRTKEQIVKSLAYNSTYALDDGEYIYKIEAIEGQVGKWGNQFQLDVKIEGRSRRYWLSNILQSEIDEMPCTTDEDKLKQRSSQKRKDEVDLTLCDLFNINGKSDIWETREFSSEDVVGMSQGRIKLSKYENKNKDPQSPYRYQNSIKGFISEADLQEEIEVIQPNDDIPF